MKNIDFKKIFAAKPKKSVTLGRGGPFRAGKNSSITFYYQNAYKDKNEDIYVVVSGYFLVDGKTKVKFDPVAIEFQRGTSGFIDGRSGTKSWPLATSIEKANEEVGKLNNEEEGPLKDVRQFVQDKILSLDNVPFDAIMNYVEKGIKPRTTPTSTKGKGKEKEKEKESDASPEVDTEGGKVGVKVSIDTLRNKNPELFKKVKEIYPEIETSPIVAVKPVGSEAPGMYWVMFKNEKYVKLHKTYLRTFNISTRKQDIDYSLDYYERMKRDHADEIASKLTWLEDILSYKQRTKKELDDIDLKFLQKINEQKSKKETEKPDVPTPSETQITQQPQPQKDKSWIKNLFQRNKRGN